MNPMSMFAGLSQDQLDAMLARLGPAAAAGGEETGEPAAAQTPGEERADPAAAKDNPFRMAASQPVPPEIAQLPPEQLDQALGRMKDSPAGGGDAKLPNNGTFTPRPQATQPAAAQPAQQAAAPFRSYQVDTSAPGAVGNLSLVTNPNEEAAALLRQQYNTGFSDFMGAGSPFGPEHDERLKVIAASLGQGRANQFLSTLEQQRAQQFGGTQADLNRQFQGKESELERAMRMGLADKQGANSLAVQGLQNSGQLANTELTGKNQIASIEAADKAGSSADKLATNAYVQSYSAAIAGGKDPISAHAAASQVADHVRAQAAKVTPGMGAGGVAVPAQGLPSNQFFNPGNGQPLVPLGPDGQPLPQNAPGAAAPGMPNVQTISRVDQLFKGIQPGLTPDKEGRLTQDQVNAATESLMSQKTTPAEAQELARRIKAGELGDASRIEAALAQQAAGNYFLAQPPTRDPQGAYPSKYEVPNLFTLRTNPNGGLGARTAAGIQNVATGGLPVPTTNGLGSFGLQSGGVPYNEVLLPGGRVVPFNPTEFRSMGGELGGANAQKKNAAQQRAAYQGMLLDALMKGR